MELPRVKIQFLNGQLGTVGESADGLMALVCGADVVNGKLTLNQPYELRSTDDLGAWRDGGKQPDPVETRDGIL